MQDYKIWFSLANHSKEIKPPSLIITFLRQDGSYSLSKKSHCVKTKAFLFHYSQKDKRNDYCIIDDFKIFPVESIRFSKQLNCIDKTVEYLMDGIGRSYFDISYEIGLV